MRRIVGSAFGPPESYLLADAPAPIPAAVEVRIRVGAVALGYVDGLIIHGRYQNRPALPYVPGGEIAGTVDAVGDAVTSLRVGDRVVTWQLGGGLADWTVVNAADVDLLELEMPLPVAAAMLVDFQTAHYALFERGRVTAGDTVLVLGASGSVASAAIQLAAQAGAHVIAAASTEAKRNAAIGMGARSAVDYSRSDWRDALKAQAPQGTVSVVFDPVGGDAFEPAFRSLGKEGRHLVVGFAAGRVASLPANLALLKSAELVGVDLRHFLASQPDRARQVRRALYSSVADGRLKAPSLVRFNLGEGQAALKATMARDRVGKIVVVP